MLSAWSSRRSRRNRRCSARRSRLRQVAGALALAVIPALALSACGSTVPPPEVAAESSPATLPYVADAPKAFDVRAQAVLAALRADGTLSTYAASLVLLSPRVVETGYPNVALKEAFGNGGFEAAPGLRGDSTTRTVTFTDGSTRSLPVLGARETLELARRGAPGCRGGRVGLPGRRHPSRARHRGGGHQPRSRQAAGLAVLGGRADDAVQRHRRRGVGARVTARAADLQ